MSERVVPQSVPAPFPWSVGVVAHNEGRSGRLRRWLEHWKPLAAEIILILHNCDDDSENIAAEFGVQPFRVNVSGLLESILWETVPLADPNLWHIRLGGCDETMTPECLAAMQRVIQENEHIRLFWISRRNYCDGVDISHILGADWQCDVMRPAPMPIRFHGAAHQYPEVLTPDVGILKPEVCWIDHHRTLDEIVSINRGRTGFTSTPGMAMQEQFIAQVMEAMRRAGKVVPQ